jgi:hypothetical protein
LTTQIHRVHLNIDIPDGPHRDSLHNRIGWLVGEQFGIEFHVSGLPFDYDGSHPLSLSLSCNGPARRKLSQRMIAEVKAFIRGALAMWETCNKDGI